LRIIYMIQCDIKQKILKKTNYITEITKVSNTKKCRNIPFL
jgi:hypothetical protein